MFSRYIAHTFPPHTHAYTHTLLAHRHVVSACPSVCRAPLPLLQQAHCRCGCRMLPSCCRTCTAGRHCITSPLSLGCLLAVSPSLIFNSLPPASRLLLVLPLSSPSLSLLPPPPAQPSAISRSGLLPPGCSSQTGTDRRMQWNTQIKKEPEEGNTGGQDKEGVAVQMDALSVTRAAAAAAAAVAALRRQHPYPPPVDAALPLPPPPHPELLWHLPWGVCLLPPLGATLPSRAHGWLSHAASRRTVGCAPALCMRGLRSWP